jgi:hypothetical protein
MRLNLSALVLKETSNGSRFSRRRDTPRPNAWSHEMYTTRCPGGFAEGGRLQALVGRRFTLLTYVLAAIARKRTGFRLISCPVTSLQHQYLR